MDVAEPLKPAVAIRRETLPRRKRGTHRSHPAVIGIPQRRDLRRICSVEVGLLAPVGPSQDLIVLIDETPYRVARESTRPHRSFIIGKKSVVLFRHGSG